MLNAAIVYGGGQIPSANYIVGCAIELVLGLLKIGNVYGVHNSYMGLANKACYERMTNEKAKEIQHQIGTYLSTCRNFDPSKNQNFFNVLSSLSALNINLLIIFGGDGSARGANDLNKKLKQANYDLRIIFIPCTIDGMNGTTTLGRDSAVEETLRSCKLLAANSWATFDNGLKGPRIAVVETMGRNRDDILLEAARRLKKEPRIGKFEGNDYRLIIIPSEGKWSYKRLIAEIEVETKPILIIVSEGAVPFEYWWYVGETAYFNSVGHRLAFYLNETGKFKANYDVVGYLSQTNEFLSEDEEERIFQWLQFMAKIINEADDYDALAIVSDDTGLHSIEINKLVEMNPNSEEKEPIPASVFKELEDYFV